MDLERRYSKQFEATSLIGICFLEVFTFKKYTFSIHFICFCVICWMFKIEPSVFLSMLKWGLWSSPIFQMRLETWPVTTIRLMSTAVKLMKQSKCQRPRFKILPAICFNKIQKLRKVTWNVKIEFWPIRTYSFLSEEQSKTSIEIYCTFPRKWRHLLLIFPKS